MSQVAISLPCLASLDRSTVSSIVAAYSDKSLAKTISDARLQWENLPIVCMAFPWVALWEGRLQNGVAGNGGRGGEWWQEVKIWGLSLWCSRTICYNSQVPTSIQL